MQEYQGHRSWNAWNVSLHINNEEPLYRAAVRAVQSGKMYKGKARQLRKAVHYFFQDTGLYMERTPDGAVYNPLCVKLTLKDYFND